MKMIAAFIFSFLTFPILASSQEQFSRDQCLQDLDKASEVLRLNTMIFSNSANAWDSLAEVTLGRGDRDKAIEYYRYAQEADSEFTSAARQLEGLLQAEGNNRYPPRRRLSNHIRGRKMTLSNNRKNVVVFALTALVLSIPAVSRCRYTSLSHRRQ